MPLISKIAHGEDPLPVGNLVLKTFDRNQTIRKLNDPVLLIVLVSHTFAKISDDTLTKCRLKLNKFHHNNDEITLTNLVFLGRKGKLEQESISAGCIQLPCVDHNCC